MTQQVAETVTFHLNKGVTAADFLAAIKTTEEFVRSSPGFVFRRLSVGEDGRWTDTVIWQDMETALKVAEEFSKQDFIPALMAAIDSESLIMRHETIQWSMTPS